MGALEKLYDFRACTPPEALFALSWDPNTVEQEVLSLRTRFLTIEEAQDKVQRGNFVLFHLPEADGYKEKQVQINVGKGFYDSTFEDKLIELALGDKVTMPQRDGNRIGTIFRWGKIF